LVLALVMLSVDSLVVALPLQLSSSRRRFRANSMSNPRSVASR